MAEHTHDLENRGKKKNIRVIRLPEGVEGTRPTTFFESWLPDFLDMETKVGEVKIERAHRTLTPKPGPNQPPRPAIRFHSYGDKQRLEASRRSETDGQAPRLVWTTWEEDGACQIKHQLHVLAVIGSLWFCAFLLTDSGTLYVSNHGAHITFYYVLCYLSGAASAHTKKEIQELFMWKEKKCLSLFFF